MPTTSSTCCLKTLMWSQIVKALSVFLLLHPVCHMRCWATQTRVLRKMPLKCMGLCTQQSIQACHAQRDQTIRVVKVIWVQAIRHASAVQQGQHGPAHKLSHLFL